MEQKRALVRSVRRPNKGQAHNLIRGELARESEMVEVKRRGIPLPKQMPDNPLMTQRFRFRQNAAGNAEVTASCLFNLKAVSTGSTSFKSFFGSLRLLKVECWTSTVSVTGGGNNMGLEFFPNLGADAFDQGPPQVFEAVSTGTSQPGHIHIRPGVLTKLGRPMNAAIGSTDIVFRKSGQVGDIVEVTIEYTLLDGSIQNNRSLTGSGGSAGYIMENTFLDNTSTTGVSGSQLLTTLTGFIQAVIVG